MLARLGVNNISFGLCLELYAYILITNSLKPQGIGPGHALQYDSFVMSLSNLGAYSTFGTMFGSCHGLLELIPQVTLLASQRLTEEHAGIVSTSQYLHEMHDILKYEIDTWQLPESFPSDDYDYAEANSAADAFRHGLRVYLITAVTGSLVSDPATLETIQVHVDAIMDAACRVGQTGHATIMLWPLTIAGSCMTNISQRKDFVQRLKSSHFRMQHVFAVCEVLDMLWKTDDPRAFGPYGLFLMEQKGFCVPIL
jgi:hypothetical protein